MGRKGKRRRREGWRERERPKPDKGSGSKTVGAKCMWVKETLNLGK